MNVDDVVLPLDLRSIGIDMEGSFNRKTRPRA
jgi:hypothetical protein